MIPKPNPHLGRRAVDAFNAAHPVEAEVLVAFEGGAERPGKITARAYLHGARGVVVRVAFGGIDGLFPITRVRLNPEQP